MPVSINPLGARLGAAALALSLIADVGAAQAQTASFTPEQRLEIERIVEDLVIRRMRGEGGGADGGGSGGSGGGGSGGGGSADMVDATDPSKIAEIAGEFGSAELTADSLGDPMVRGQMNGVSYDVYFYGCTDAQGCKNLQFRAVWSYQGATDEDVMRWNREKRFGKAYRDADGNLVIEMNVNVDFGVSDQNMSDTFDWWRVVLDEFAVFFNL